MSAFDHSPTPADRAKKHHHRPWFIMGGLALLLTGMGCWLFFFHDAPAPDDADMMPQWSERGGNANPLARFLATLETSRIPEVSDLPMEALMLEANSSEQVDAFLENQAEALAAFHELMRTNPATWQWPDADRLLLFAETPAYLPLLPQFTATVRLKALRLASQGQLSEAAEHCLLLARFAHAAQQAEGTFVQVLQMMRAQQSGETLLERVLTSGDASPALLRHCSAELTPIEGPSREGMQFAIKSNYQWFKQCANNKDMRGRMLANLYSRREASWINTTLVKPHRTLVMRLQLDRPLLERFSKDWQDIAGALPEGSKKQKDLLQSKKGVRRLLDSNLGGRRMVVTEAEDQNSVLEQLLKSLMRSRQTRLVLALRLHELEKGVLPEKLESLVPDYLPSVPVDEHSGQPMRWNRAAHALYSVGADGVDDGGEFEHGGFARTKDIGTIYWWEMFAAPVSKN